VPTDPGIPPRHQSLGKGRMEALSDGVFSFASTLLVVDIAVNPPGTPLQQVLNAWPAYLGYVVSFLTIGSAWISHSGLTDRLERIDPIFLRINLLILFTIAFLPFPTRLVSQALQDTAGEQVAVTLYGLTLLAIRILGSTLDAYCRREHLYTEQVHSDELQRSRRKLLPALIAYVIAILLGLVVPDAAVALYFGIAVYLVVPFRDIARLARRS
jgi:uncharacterized membrane protein